MKIAEIVNLIADEEPEAARISNFMQRIANAFTQGGRVKRPLGFQGLGTESTTTVLPTSVPELVQSADVSLSAATATPRVS